MLAQILRACVPISLALLLFRLVWLGLARRYKFTCLFAAVQVSVSIWLLYRFPNVETAGYTWAWILTRWPIMALLVGSVLELCSHICVHQNPRWLSRLALLLLPGTTATFAAAMLWQCFAIEWHSPYLVVRLFQITCLVYASLFFAAVFFLIIVRLYVAPSLFKPNLVANWTFLTLFLTVQSVMIFLMNVLNGEENMNIGYIGTPIVVVVLTAWSLSLSVERKHSQSTYFAQIQTADEPLFRRSSVRAGGRSDG
jgi:hypothetical protein